MPENSLYVDVAVTVPAETTFLYRVPEKFVSCAEPGRRVLVPFGRRRITGYITGISKLSERGFSIKEIIDIPDEPPFFHASQLPLFEWISRYYLFPIGEVIKSALPGGINVSDSVRAEITEEGRKALLETDPDTADASLLKQLNNKSVYTGLLGGNNARNRLKTLEAKGFIRLVRELKKEKVRLKTERFIRSAGRELPTDRLTEKRKKLVSFIRNREVISVKELKTYFPTAAGFFSFLESEGHIVFFEKEVFRDPFGEAIEPAEPPILMPEQKEIVETISEKIGTGFSPFVLAGVTGSGKTEVYMKLIEAAVRKGLSAIVLVPEISLISQTERRFRSRFGDTIAVIHSGLSMGEKYDQWRRIATKEVSIVIGARSAVFAPVEKTGIIIVDEEHDASYKQENGLKYNGRDLAAVRARLDGAVFLSGSATPSIQSWYNTRIGKYQALKLTKRVSDRPLPEIEIIDLKKYQDLPGMRSFITPPLEQLMQDTLEKKEQILLFLNRRGYANYPVCATCGEPVKCVSCDVTLTLHKQSNAYRCHMCGYMASAKSKCRLCNSSQIKHLGFGTEKIEAAVKARFPEAVVGRMDQDTTTKRGAVVKILKKVKEQKTDILIGTQMIAKGHDFPGITLVGIICADQSLNFPDFRACERTFQLLAQVAGRAGRGDRPGKVILQTYNPDHFSITAAKSQNFYAFYDQEIEFRKNIGYPPFSRMVMIKISSRDRRIAKDSAERTGVFLNNLLVQGGRSFSEVAILGPIEAAIPKLADRYRWQILLKSSDNAQLHRVSEILSVETSKSLKKKDVRITIDIDPYYMM